MTKSVAQGLAAYATDADLRAAKVRLKEAMPNSGWLHEYLKAVTPLTDAPVEFHLASGLAALSAAAGNRLWAVHWNQNIYPHLWAVLVAPSSFWRKSTSINQAENLLREADPNAVYPSDFSREKFLRIVAEHPSGMLALKEFGGFLAALGRDYNGGLKENLTELFDGPDLFVRSLQSGNIEIRNPAITMLGATTLDWLEGRITEGDLQGGFLARYLFVTAREKASAKGLTDGMDIITRNDLRRALHEVLERQPTQIAYDPEAREQLDEWMQGWEQEVTGTNHRADLSGFAVRLQTYAVKLAMLYRISAVALDGLAEVYRIDVASVTAAIAYCRVLWANVTGLIDEKIAITKDAKELRRLAHIIGAGATRSQTLKLSKLRARDFDQFLDTLVQGGQIHVAKVYGSEVGLDRTQDKMVTWLSPVEVTPTGPSVPGPYSQFPTASGPGEFTGTDGVTDSLGENGELMGTERAEVVHESDVSTQFSLSPIDTGKDAPPQGGYTRMREELTDDGQPPSKRGRPKLTVVDPESML